MKKITILVILLCSILLFSCSEDIDSSLLINPQIAESGDSINNFFVNSESALNTAKNFWSMKSEENFENKKNESITSKVVDKINEFKDDENNTVFYILFNFRKFYLPCLQ